MKNLIPLIVIFFTAVGCTSSTDVSHDPRYYGGYVPGQIYRLTVAGKVYQTAPQTCILAMKSSPSADYPGSTPIFEELPIGTHIKVDKLVHTTVSAPIQGESQVQVFATPIDRTCNCGSIRLDDTFSTWKSVRTPDGWPTMIGFPDPSKLGEAN
jgi:hypothetical protein